MSKDTDKGQRALDAHQATTADAKLTYEAPVVISLGELARGLGAKCTSGSIASGQGANICNDGGAATDLGGNNPACGAGSIPFP